MSNIRIIKAENLGKLVVLLTFSDNTTQVVDVGEYIRLHPHPQYNKYYDPKRFLEFKVENDTVVWGDDWDLIFHPENLYHNDLFGYYEE